MIELIYTHFTIDTIYLWLNIGVIPFWIMLLFFPETKLCKIFVTSIFPILIFAVVDFYLILEFYKSGFSLINGFNLYLGLDELINLFSDQNYVILFWVHFLAINLFCGSWVVKDYQKNNMPKLLVFFPLLLTYFVGPLGICIYWLFRIFYSKKIDLYE